MRAVALILLALALGPVACGDGTSPREWLAAAEEAHREADLLEQAGDRAGAARLLRESAESPAPERTHAEDARVVRQDLYYRLAAVELAQHRLTEAIAAATRGLELGRRQDVFTASLLVVRGQALEEQGDPRAASRDYHEALLVNEALLEAHLSSKKAP
jgi:tetratricopeptide (TPR) repeat protein